jgi:hypothetical protein
MPTPLLVGAGAGAADDDHAVGLDADVLRLAGLSQDIGEHHG